MISPTKSSPPCATQQLQTTPSPQTRHIASPANDTMSSPTPHARTPRTPLSPGDCRTLEKILSDVRDHERGKTLAETERVASQDETGMVHDGEVFSYEGDGYEDEDEDLSEELTEEDWNGDATELEEVDDEVETDTIEDVMNLPGQTAPPARTQDFGEFGGNDEGVFMSAEAQEFAESRAVIEKRLERERVEKKSQIQPALAEDDTYDDDNVLEQNDGSSADDIADLPINVPAQKWTIPLDPNGMLTVVDDSENHSRDSTFSSIKLLVKASYKGKENSPTKRRRKAASPEEIAELAREVGEDDGHNYTQKSSADTDDHGDDDDEMSQEDMDDLNQYRDMDLAPLEHIIQGGSAGDLITFGTPVRARDASLLHSESWDPSSDEELEREIQHGTATSPPALRFYKTNMVDTPNLLPLVPQNSPSTPAHRNSSPLPSTLLAEQMSSTSTPTPFPTDSEPFKVLEPTTLPVPTKAPDQAHVYPDTSQAAADASTEVTKVTEAAHPVFTNIIAMLPRTLFWVAAAPVTKYASKAYDVLIEKVTGLELEGEDEGGE